MIHGLPLPEPRRGDLLAVPGTGAYTLAMASNYNWVPRPGAVLVANGESRLIRKRETIADLLADEILDRADRGTRHGERLERGGRGHLTGPELTTSVSWRVADRPYASGTVLATRAARRRTVSGASRPRSGQAAREARWARLGSNQGPPACEAGALPLSYAPRGTSHRDLRQHRGPLL